MFFPNFLTSKINVLLVVLICKSNQVELKTSKEDVSVSRVIVSDNTNSCWKSTILERSSIKEYNYFFPFSMNSISISLVITTIYMINWFIITNENKRYI